MLALLFEVTPKPDAYQQYLDIAAGLRSSLEQQDGFLFIDRFRSLAHPETILSHSLWRDEAALAAWRTFEPHHRAQALGRERIFIDYRLRIAQVVQEETPEKPVWRPARLTAYRDPTVHAPRYVVIAASTHAPCGEAPHAFESLNRPGAFLSLYDSPDRDAALELIGCLWKGRSTDASIDSIRLCEVERDYGMFDRREAPQYYPPVPRTESRPATAAGTAGGNNR